jgi:hypothetical protein
MHCFFQYCHVGAVGDVDLLPKSCCSAPKEPAFGAWTCLSVFTKSTSFFVVVPLRTKLRQSQPAGIDGDEKQHFNSQMGSFSDILFGII